MGLLLALVTTTWIHTQTISFSSTIILLFHLMPVSSTLAFQQVFDYIFHVSPVFIPHSLIWWLSSISNIDYYLFSTVKHTHRIPATVLHVLWCGCYGNRSHHRIGSGVWEKEGWGTAGKGERGGLCGGSCTEEAAVCFNLSQMAGE